MSAYTEFVKSYHRKHPSLKGKGFIRAAAKAWRGRHRRRNPEVTTSPDEVVLVIPTELLHEMHEHGGEYEGVPMENPGFFTGSDGRVHPIREGGDYLSRRGKKSWGGSYDRAADASERRRREKVRAALPSHRRRRRNPLMECPSCGHLFHVPSGAASGNCPYCGRRVHVVG